MNVSALHDSILCGSPAAAPPIVETVEGSFQNSVSSTRRHFVTKWIHHFGARIEGQRGGGKTRLTFFFMRIRNKV